jgi:uncharacterized protein HemX
LAKLSQGKTVYTAYFEGKEIRTPLEITEPPKAETPSGEPEDTVPKSPEAPAEEPAEEPKAEPVDEPAEKPAAEPAEETEDETENETEDEPAAVPIAGGGTNPALYVIIALLSLLVAGGAFYIIKNRKGNTTYEKDIDTFADPRDDDGGGDSGFGG